jgi:hypothetical protein
MHRELLHLRAVLDTSIDETVVGLIARKLEEQRTR